MVYHLLFKLLLFNCKYTVLQLELLARQLRIVCSQSLIEKSLGNMGLWISSTLTYV